MERDPGSKGLLSRPGAKAPESVEFFPRLREPLFGVGASLDRRPSLLRDKDETGPRVVRRVGPRYLGARLPFGPGRLCALVDCELLDRGVLEGLRGASGRVAVVGVVEVALAFVVS